MSHVLKIFLKIIHARIYSKCEDNMGNTQFGFKNGMGTREALFSMQVLVQRCRDVSVDVFACFIDYEKAFDTIQHGKLIEILKKLNLDERDIRIIMNLYWHQKAKVTVDGEVSDQIEIMRGVRQGCVLSPLLFNLYSEAIFQEALHGKHQGIILNGTIVNNLRYADDTILLANTLEDLQQLLNCVADRSRAMGLKLNISKTKWLVVSKQKDIIGRLEYEGKPIERVQFHKYLGCLLNADWDATQEIRSRIEQARSAFIKMRTVLCSRDIDLALRIRVLKCYVFSILLYGAESWTLTETMCKRLEAFEMWTYRRMLRISWVDKVRNTEVLNQLSKQTEIINTIKKRKLEYFGHILRNSKYQLLQLIMQGKIDGKRGPGRRRTSWLKNLRQWYGASTRTLFRRAVNKLQIALMIANVR